MWQGIQASFKSEVTHLHTYPDCLRMGRAFFQIAGVFAELERGMINARTKAGIQKARKDGVKFGRIRGSKNKNTKDKHEKIKIFLQAGKSYDWIANELCVSKKTIADVKKSMIIKQDF